MTHPLCTAWLVFYTLPFLMHKMVAAHHFVHEPISLPLPPPAYLPVSRPPPPSALLHDRSLTENDFHAATHLMVLTRL